MIVVDSSVWIAHLRNSESRAVRALRALQPPDEILIGDVILLEVLQGARNEQHAAEIESNLRQFRMERMLDDELAVRAARHYRTLRERGTTIYKTIDLIIATFCIERGHQLLHEDRDFDRIAAHLNLQTI
jgi:predicted nucleic acid-binding protein